MGGTRLDPNFYNLRRIVKLSGRIADGDFAMLSCIVKHDIVEIVRFSKCVPASLPYSFEIKPGKIGLFWILVTLYSGFLSFPLCSKCHAEDCNDFSLSFMIQRVRTITGFFVFDGSWKILK